MHSTHEKHTAAHILATVDLFVGMGRGGGAVVDA